MKKFFSGLLGTALLAGLVACSPPVQPVEQPRKSDAKALTSFSLVIPQTGSESTTEIVGQISGEVVQLTLPFGTDVKALVAQFSFLGTHVSIGKKPQISGQSSNDFSRIVVYTVFAQDGTSRDYFVQVSVSGKTANRLLSFAIVSPPAEGVIVEQEDTGQVDVLVPAGTNLTSLVASFTAEGVVQIQGVVQDSGKTNLDFSHPVIYTVVADSGHQRQYTVLVHTPKIQPKQLLSFGFPDVPYAQGVIEGNSVTVKLPYKTNLADVKPVFTLTGKALKAGTQSLTSGLATSLLGVSTLTVEGADGSTLEYNLTLTVSTTPTAYVSLEVRNLPLETASPLAFVGAFPTSGWANTLRQFTVNSGAGVFGADAPEPVMVPGMFGFSLVTPGTWTRPWYPARTATNPDGSLPRNWALPLPLDGKVHRLVIDGSTPVMAVVDLDQPRRLQLQEDGQPTLLFHSLPTLAFADTSTTKTLSVKHLGTQPVNLFKGTDPFAGSAGWSVTSALPSVIQPGDSFDLTVKFAPAGSGSSTGTLNLKDVDGTLLLQASFSGKKDEPLVPVVGLIGDAVPVTGWVTDAYFLTGYQNTWSTLVYLKPGQFKLRVNKAWTVSYGSDNKPSLTLKFGTAEVQGYGLAAAPITIASAGFYFLKADPTAKTFIVQPVTSVSIVQAGGSTPLVADQATNVWTASAALTAGPLWLELNGDPAFKMAPVDATGVLDVAGNFTNPAAGTKTVTLDGKTNLLTLQ